MKRFVSVLLVFGMILSAIPAFARTDAEEALLKVKEKIDIPEFLTEFSYTENKYEDAIRYDFMWLNEDENKEMYVSADKSGRIATYSYYEWGQDSEKGLIGYTQKDATTEAERIAKRFFPEYFEDGGKDVLRLDEESTTSRYTGRYKTFSFTFDRFFEGERVESNFVSVTVRAEKDKIYVQEVEASLDTNAKFLNAKSAFSDEEKEGKYEEKFPTELFYATDYSSGEEKVKLYYKTEKGYVAYETGEAVTKKDFDRYGNEFKTEDAESSAGVTFGRGDNALSEKEQNEIDKMNALVKIEEIEKKLRGLKILKITDDMKITSKNTYASDEKYFVRFTMEGDERAANVTYNGETGEIKGLYLYFKKYDEAKYGETKSDLPKEEILELVRALAGEKADEVDTEFNDYTMLATRRVNGVLFPENRIRVIYNGKNDTVTSYSLEWTDDVSQFAKPEEAMDIEKARGVIYDNGFAENVWVKSEDGYIRAVSVKETKVIDAVTGKKQYENEDEKKSYTDVENHWVKDAAKALWEHDIYLRGDMLKPDEKITLPDMIRLFKACDNGRMLSWSMSDEEVINYAKEQKYITDASVEDFVERREAFRVMTEILGYGEVGKLDIYKSSYTDAEADGNAEILKAMGVLTGNEARMEDCLTRGEAVVMVYRYLNR